MRTAGPPQSTPARLSRRQRQPGAFSPPEQRRLGAALAASLAVHALLASLTFGGNGAGLPGLGWPWQERRVEVPAVRLRLELPQPLPPLPEPAGAVSVVEPALVAVGTAPTAELALAPKPVTAPVMAVPEPPPTVVPEAPAAPVNASAATVAPSQSPCCVPKVTVRPDGHRRG